MRLGAGILSWVLVCRTIEKQNKTAKFKLKRYRKISFNFPMHWNSASENILLHFKCFGIVLGSNWYLEITKSASLTALLSLLLFCQLCVVRPFPLLVLPIEAPFWNIKMVIHWTLDNSSQLFWTCQLSVGQLINEQGWIIFMMES